MINLKRCTDRKKHTIQEFTRVGIKQYEFIEAVDKDDPEVLQWIQSGKVAQFPPCFRCGQNHCNCFNNILIPQQIANWCSFIKVWKDILDKNYDFCLICEDDLKFTHHFNESIKTLFSRESFEKNNINKHQPLLIRLGKGLEKKHKKKIFEKHYFTQEKTMSNPCFAINRAMAKLLLENVHNINHTSDVYIHEQIIQKHPEIQHFTAMPIPVFELSSHGTIKFYSEIRPKGIDAQDKIRQKNTLVRKEYKELLCLSHPRCGSGYASFLLKQLGLDVGHEDMGINGVSSWMLAAEDTDYPWGDIGNEKKSGSIHRYYFANTIHVIRDPISAIPSIILENQHSRNNDSYLFRRKHLMKLLNIQLPANVSNDNAIELAVIMYLAWNKIIDKHHPDFIFRIEHDQEKFAQFLLKRNLIKEVPENFAALYNTKINANKKYVGAVYEKPNISADDIIKNLQTETLEQLRQFCQQYGYTL
ncbi:MAG: glycosyltransferase family 25 protein [Pseudomonadota bacterium]